LASRSATPKENSLPVVKKYIKTEKISETAEPTACLKLEIICVALSLFGQLSQFVMPIIRISLAC